MSFSHISSPIRAVTRNTFARKFITLGRVINLWDQVVGPDMATKTYPLGMSVRKKQKKSSSTTPGAPTSPITKTELEATLEIAASSSDATILHYQKSLLLERLATLLGARMIVDIKITHTGPRTSLGVLGARDHMPKSGDQNLTPDLNDDQDPLEMALQNLQGAILNTPSPRKPL